MRHSSSASLALELLPTDTSGVLMFDNSGKLIILDGRGSLFTVAYGSGAKDTEAAILDSGNLVLRSVSNWSRVRWQSFDHPTDTWLPGMNLGFVGAQNQLLTSWRSSDDPAIGDYSFGLDPNDKTNFFIWERGNVFYKSGPWNGDWYDFTESQSLSMRFVTNDNLTTLNYYTIPVGGIARYVLDHSGQLKLLERMDFVLHQWLLLGSWPQGSCKAYSPCGAFGICAEYPGKQNRCKCPKGFNPGDGVGWSSGDTRRGCIRQTNLHCVGDKFLRMTNMGLPGNATPISSITGQKQCESICLMKCSCTAYAVLQDECNLWYGTIMHLREQQSGDAVANFYLRLAASELESTGAPVVLIAATVSSVAFLIFASLLFLLWIWRKKRKAKEVDTDSAIKLLESELTGTHFTSFCFSEIADATCNFLPENKLGEGGFGPVYKGNLPEGQEIAVKRLAAHSGQGILEFKNEIMLIAKLQHRNLVRLLGCCIQGEEKILIYEYMPNKSLDFFLFEQSRREMLDWATRINIIEGIAQGLLYLHKHSRFRIIHRDLKASNILLDIDMNPKISDFGLARIFGSKETEANTKRVVGTYGYMAPEYAMEGIFSVKSSCF
uniref:non-specific serine/threonine protein kinase n=1 Tax=Leersia perrieri TaxID=77586 RepID=A0A0D9V6J2_9ORYZ